ALQIFDTLKEIHNLNTYYKNILIVASKLCHIGEYLNFYFANEHSANFILGGLNYGFSHKEKALIATIIKLNGKKAIPYNLEHFKQLLPNSQIITWLGFMLTLAKTLSFSEEKINFSFCKDTLYIYNKDQKLNLSKDEIKKITKPSNINISINQVP
ncbi:Ppx/GppA family phosphatase, partial [Campylobacter sp. TTU-622]|nr:Ppx/GppA family phosphatase [Campylobacter sp. TTU-622]